MKNTIFIFLLLMGFSGCASVNPINPMFKIIDMPTLGHVQEAELGDSIVAKGNLYLWQGIDLKNEVKGGTLGLTVTLTPQKLTARFEDEESIYYMTDKVLWDDSLLGKKYVWGGLVVSKRDKSSNRMFANKFVTQWTPKPSPIINFVEVTAIEQPSFKQELIYNGRSGEVVKFLYREISEATIRAPFSQEIQYDLKDGNTIGFKGSRIEILQATNMTLKYKVISNFGSMQ